MNKIAASLLSIASTLAALSVGSIAQAQSALPRYTDPAPMPQVSRITDTIIYGTDLNGVTHFTAAGYMSETTADGNLYVTRIVGQEQSRSLSTQVVQVDCGRGLFRFAFMRQDGEDIPVEPTWSPLNFDRTKPSAQIMVRTCEMAASDRGINWQWVSR